MPTFTYTFTVPAPRQAVSAFHHDTRVLPKLSPPPIFVRLHRFEPLADGSEAEFTMWFGPIPLRWRAVHSDVGPAGFTDTQVSGPLARWEHTHRFRPLGADATRVEETVVYEHAPGLRGIFTRLLFNRPALTLLFTYRQLVTRRSLRNQKESGADGARRKQIAGGALVALLFLCLWWLASRPRGVAR